MPFFTTEKSRSATDSDDPIETKQENLAREREKNKQIQNLLTELRDLDVINTELNGRVEQLKRELVNATAELNQSADDMNRIQTQFSDVHEMNRSMLKEKEQLLFEMDQLRERVTKIETEDDMIATKFSEQVDTLITMMAEKELELKQLRDKLDRNGVSPFMGRFESGREMDLNKLRRNLEDATFQLEEQNALLLNSQEEIKFKAQKIDQLEKEAKEMVQELKDCQDELEYVRECAKMKDVDPSFDPNSLKSNQIDQLKILQLQQQLVKLEDEKISLMHELHQYQSTRSKDNRNITLDEKDDRNEKIELLEKENGELRLGMKEILVGLRESDGQSDIIIDCPSLERVCQFLESRAISADLQNVIALKAELDLLRGQNDQLRSDTKQLRSDRLRLMAFCTEYILREDGVPPSETEDLSQGEMPREAPVRMEQDDDEVPQADETEVPIPEVVKIALSQMGVENFAQTDDESLFPKPEEYICNRCPKVLKALEEVLLRMDKMIALKRATK